jgi:hypothetical protein
MENEKDTHNKRFYQSFPLFLKGSAIVGAIYAFYYIYAVSEFSFVQGVDNSSKTKDTLTIAFLHDDERMQYFASPLPKEVKDICNSPSIVREYIVEKEEQPDGMEKIKTTGSRQSSSLEVEPPDIDILAALEKVGAKIVKDETSKFLAVYSTKISIDGLYSLYAIPESNQKKWQLSIRNKCIRVLRVFNEENELKVGTEIVFNIEYAKSTDAIRITPILVTIDNAAAKSISPFVTMDIKLETNWLVESDYEDSITNLRKETSMSFGRLPIGEPLSLVDHNELKNYMQTIIAIKLVNTSSWMSAPHFRKSQIDDCIEKRKECEFVVGDISFNLLETGEGAKLISDISSMINE